MAERRSITVDGVSHANPIPAASRVGPLLMSGIVNGLPLEGESSGLRSEVEAMFAKVQAIVEAAGGQMDHVVKINVWLKDPADRADLNAVWLQYFPDPDRRPARHAQAQTSGAKALIQCDFTAYIPS